MFGYETTNEAEDRTHMLKLKINPKSSMDQRQGDINLYEKKRSWEVNQPNRLNAFVCIYQSPNVLGAETSNKMRQEKKRTIFGPKVIKAGK